jgi:(2Fe-2S) ferredoxin
VTEPAVSGVPASLAPGIRPPRHGVPGIAERCAPSAERRGDQLAGSAAPVRSWLLVEQPGPWGRNALRQSNVDSTVAADLADRAGAIAGLRLLLIRRPGRPVADGIQRWAYVDSRPGREGMWWGEYTEPRQLLDLPLAEPPGGAPATDPAYLVCTHGSHDACCAIRGRTVAAALAAVRPAATWECSHVGGDRFAANVVVLPHGLYYGHVTPEKAPELALAHDRGRVVPALLRGRSSFAAPVQAAEHYARRELGEDRLDALAPRQVDRLAESRWRVTLDADGGPIAVTVQAGRMPAPVRLTCSSRDLETARVFRLIAMEGVG